MRGVLCRSAVIRCCRPFVTPLLFLLILSGLGLSDDGDSLWSYEGVSIIEFNEDDLVIRHSDYFDVGAMVYERVPVVRALVKFVKNKLNAGIEE